MGALASLTVVLGALTAQVSDKLRVISIRATYTWADIQAVIDDGLTFGLAHSDYSAAEVEECLEANTAIDLGDKVAQERANRLVREIGAISGQVDIGGGLMFNDGRPVKTRLNWLLAAGDQLNIWVRNSSGVVWTTGSEIVTSGEIWVKD